MSTSSPSSEPTPRAAGTRRRVLLGVAVVAALGALALVVKMLVGSPAEQADPAPAYVPPAQLATGVSSVAEASAAATSSTATAGEAMAGMAGVPRGSATRVRVTNPDGKALVDAPLSAYPASRGLEFSPDRGQAAWWDSGQYGAPGATEQSVVAGHVRFEGTPDVFYNLGTTQVGATVTVTYDSGDVATFRVTEKLDAPKADVVDARTAVGKKVWQDGELSLVTCDLSSGTQADGHLKGNTVLVTERVS